MTSPNESRPAGNRTAILKHIVGAASETDSTATIDVTKLTESEWRIAMEFYASGYTHGVGAGRKFADDEAAAIGREAARIVHLMAGIPERDRDADRERRRRIDARFNERRPA